VHFVWKNGKFLLIEGNVCIKTKISRNWRLKKSLDLEMIKKGNNYVKELRIKIYGNVWLSKIK